MEDTKHMSWDETTGNDRRLPAADVVIRSITDLKTPAATLTHDLYFEGADVLHCTAGRFRFTIDGERQIEIGPGETLVTYPDHRVTIEATEADNRLVYGIFCGSTVEDYLDALGFFHGMHGKTSAQDESLANLRHLLAESKDDPVSNSACLSLLTDILTTLAVDLREQGNALLGDAVRQIRANLSRGIVRLEPLCEQLHVSRAHLHAVFVRAGLKSPSDFIRHEQLRLALRLLRTTQQPVADIARRAGFISMTHFANFMRRHTGKSARAWRTGG